MSMTDSPIPTPTPASPPTPTPAPDLAAAAPAVGAAPPPDGFVPGAAHPTAAASRQASKAALGLPANHPGFVPLSPDPWQPYAVCAGACGRPVSHHQPSDEERAYSTRHLFGDRAPSDVQLLDVAHHAVVAGTNDSQVGLVCSMGCLYIKDPAHPAFAGMTDPATQLRSEIKRARRVLALKQVDELMRDDSIEEEDTANA